MSKAVLSDLTENTLITNDIIESLVVEVSEFFSHTKADVIEVSSLTPGLMHNQKLETVFEYLGYSLDYPSHSDNIIRIRRSND